LRLRGLCGERDGLSRLRPSLPAALVDSAAAQRPRTATRLGRALAGPAADPAGDRLAGEPPGAPRPAAALRGPGTDRNPRPCQEPRGGPEPGPRPGDRAAP